MITLKIKPQDPGENENHIERHYTSREAAQGGVNEFYLKGYVSVEEWRKHTDYLSSVDAQGKRISLIEEAVSAAG